MKFSRFQLFFLIILYVGISNHVILLPHLISVSNRDAWIASLIAYFFLLVWGIILKFILKSMNRNSLLVWSQKKMGRVITYTLLSLFSFYIVITSLITFNDLVNTIQIYFLPRTPILFTGLAFLLLSVCIAYKNLKTLVYLSLILSPMVIILGVFVALSTMGGKDYSLLFPNFTNGMEPIIKGAIMVVGANADILFLFLIQNQMKKEYSSLDFFVIITTLIILVIGPTTGAIAAFGPEIASEMRFPAFEQWRLVSIGETISHVDFLAVFQLLAGSIIRMALSIYLLWSIWENPSLKFRRILIGAYSIFILIIMMHPNADVYLQTIMERYFYFYSFIFAIFITVFLLIASYFKRGGTSS
ncbi:endospore germination permease [Virgibacillus halodenitrificans]|uniref:GerAB/ArcD/ProY family transporter n=1 Tax=Virgibacillus halodenitrificans TaxID=1482 RepID=UPI0024C09600|nr:endospore germination permease [Virgibacillus halodenitrificans]WHX27809.1 endospore germination permease [Virgibacillus halodenitrificans]